MVESLVRSSSCLNQLNMNGNGNALNIIMYVCISSKVVSPGLQSAAPLSFSPPFSVSKVTCCQTPSSSAAHSPG